MQIISLTDVERTYQQLAMVWGVLPQLVPHDASHTYDTMVQHGLAAVRQLGLANAGDRVIVTAGVPFDQTGTTNFLKVEAV